MSSLKIIIPILIVSILIGAGAYSIYRTQTALESTEIVQQNNFPSPTPTPSTDPQIKSAVSATNQPATGPEDEITIGNIGIQITTPKSQSKITSPITISGRANVTSQVVKITVIDSNGIILGKGQATACVGLDACQFSASIPFGTPSTQSGIIEVYSPSTLDNSRTYLQTIPISF